MQEPSAQEELPAQEPSVQKEPPAQELSIQEKPLVQESSKAEDFKKYEIKIDLLHSLLSTVKVGGEYWLDIRNAVTIAALYNFTKNHEVQGQILAGYKLYFLKFRKGPWFFAECDLGYTKGYDNCGTYFCHEDYEDPYILPSEDKPPERYHAFTVSLAGGVKFFVPKTDTGIETIFGFSRLYGGNTELEAIPNFGVSLVRRF